MHKVSRATTAVIAGIGWAVAALDMLGVLDLTFEQSNFALCAAVALTAGVMLCIRRRPLGTAYDMGYEHGRRDAVRLASCTSGRVVHLERKVVEPLPEWSRV